MSAATPAVPVHASRGVASQEPLPDTLDCRLQPLRCERFEKVVDGVELKCTQGVLIISGGKYDGRHRHVFLCSEGSNNIEAIHTRHANVEEQECGFRSANKLDGLIRGGTFTYDLNIALIAQELTQFLPGQHFVIRYNSLNHSAPYLVMLFPFFVDNWNGRIIVTLT